MILPNQDLLISRGPDKGSLFIDGEHTCHISQIHRCLWHNLSLKLTWQKRNKQVHKLKTIVTRIFYKIKWDHREKLVFTQVENDRDGSQARICLHTISTWASFLRDGGGVVPWEIHQIFVLFLCNSKKSERNSDFQKLDKIWSKAWTHRPTLWIWWWWERSVLPLFSEAKGCQGLQTLS